MQVLEKGFYTGKIMRQMRNNGIFINTVQYALEDPNPGDHYHLNPHICFLLLGSDKEKRHGKVYARNGGDIFFYRAGEAHETVERNHLVKSIVIELDSSFINKYDLTESQLELAITNTHKLKFTLLKTLKELEYNESCNANLSIEMLLLNLFSQTKILNTAPQWLLKVKAYLHDNWNNTVSLEELAIIANVHPVTISTYFSKFHEETLSEYMRKIKIEHSLSLIKNSAISLTEIAYSCGFADQSHFVRCFKHCTGLLPKEFRKL
ncbi:MULTISPECIES: AraC family transcriptional regulator [unclassified Kaistella]|uniref:helix-turn-helix domain-containing protein n=1 Tax=unclassified Kaistella TaxID=2762626 RepID=UPI002737638E|nr:MULTISPECIES: AraC family transcriptional regulator [unclassified Kaistella]MDP2455242.1 AraC family transcriptional regulator [Kaistella sp. SH11-4b]MDP2458089.1 AraC family transcriptional regulator [Kaistella sp. SH40-3]MDP2461056.1 AraC family transcriptional regulator [Kaistella sp. SH19-2b]